MKWFYDLKIATKLVTAFLAVLVLTSLLGVISVYQLSAVSTTSAEIATNWLPNIGNALKMKVALTRYRLTELQHILATEPDVLEDEAKARESRLSEIRALREAYDKRDASTDGQALSLAFGQALAAYVDIDRQAIELSGTGKKDEARSLLRGDSALTLYRKLNTVIDDMVKLNEARGVRSAEGAANTYASAREWTIALLVVNVAVGLMLAFWLARLVSRPLHRAVAIATQVAEGDLTVRIAASSRDETGQMMSALEAMTTSLQRIVGGVRGSADSIATASGQIVSGNADLSARTEEQAATLEQTAASMTQLTQTVRQNSDNARQANALATRATDMADAGNDAVQEMVRSIGEVSESSDKVSQITGVIEGIAFQTNILALNAAVESARAGESGRGFAVVASEVRNLAQRSTNAAKEIKVLLDASVENVRAGAQQVDLAGRTIAELTDAIGNVATITAEISASAHEQSRSIDEINQAVSLMDQSTQQNAALVEEIAAASQSLKAQGRELHTTVSFFKLD